MIIEYNGKKKSRANRLSMGRLYSKGYSGDIGEEDNEDDSLQDESEPEYSVIEQKEACPKLLGKPLLAYLTYQSKYLLYISFTLSTYTTNDG